MVPVVGRKLPGAPGSCQQQPGRHQEQQGAARSSKGAARVCQEQQGAAMGAAREKTVWIWKDIDGSWRICVDLGSAVGQGVLTPLEGLGRPWPPLARLKSPRRVSLKTSTQILEACKLKACRLPGWLSGLPGCLACLAVYLAWLSSLSGWLGRLAPWLGCFAWLAG